MTGSRLLNQPPDESYKVVIVGDSMVGKTSLLSMYATNSFSDDSIPTIGNSYVQISAPLDNACIGLNVWDTAGQERFRSLVPLYARDAYCAIIVFDLTTPQTFYHIDHWYATLREDVGLNCPIILCGNKADLESQIDADTIFSWSSEHNCETFLTSAKIGKNVRELFRRVAIQAQTYQYHKKEEPSYSFSSSSQKNQRIGFTCC